MRGCLAACLLALSLASTAAAGDEAPKQPFIERTLVVAPLKVGDFVLEGSRYDPANRFAGVALRYFLPGQEETRIDLFVYPHGRSDPDEALDRGMRDFRATLEAAQQAGYYRGLTVADDIEFDIPLPAALPDADDADQVADQPAQPADADAADPDPDPEEAARLETLLSLLGEGRRIDGRMIELAYDYPGQADDEWLPMHSRGYLLYRHLHFFKGRISAAGARIDHAAFAALSDRAMRELVPAVQAWNIGSCGDTTIYVDSDLSNKDGADMLMRQLVAAQTRSEASNCHKQADEAELAALAEDSEVVVIEYSPDDWRGE